MCITFLELDPLILKFSWKNEHVRVDGKSLKKEHWGVTLPDIKMLWITSVLLAHEETDRPIEQKAMKEIQVYIEKLVIW